jgi:hypothetical protein
VFKHEKLDGEKFRVIPVSGSFIKESILELREPKNWAAYEAANRQQYAVAEDTLVERFLPPQTKGDSWPHDALGTVWWEVVSHPPHGGIISTFNSALGGTYMRELKPENNVVAFAEQGEEIVMASGEYVVIREKDKQELRAPSLLALRRCYFSA